MGPYRRHWAKRKESERGIRSSPWDIQAWPHYRSASGSSSSSTQISDDERQVAEAQAKSQTDYQQMDWRQTKCTTQANSNCLFDNSDYDQVPSGTLDKALPTISQEDSLPSRTWAEVLSAPPVVLNTPKAPSLVVLGGKRSCS
jgi:hypothetical protein